MNRWRGDTHESPKKNWVVTLCCINLAALIAVPVEFFHGPFQTALFLRTLLYAVIYANITGLAGMLLLSRLVERLAPKRIPLASLIAGGIFLCTALGCLLAQWIVAALQGFNFTPHFWRDYFDTLKLAMPLALVFGLGTFVYASFKQRIHDVQLAEERTRKLAAEAKLRSLEARIQPHFLFNTLNSVMALIPVNPHQAENMVGKLAILLRASLDTTSHTLIPLHQELTMVESYLEIESTRFGPKLKTTIAVPPEFLEVKVPPMSVQSLVENAVKHGITPSKDNGEVRITASALQGELRVFVEDSGAGFDLSAIRAGHGLDNLVERLQAIFGQSARLNVHRKDNRTLVEMILPLA